MVRAQSHVTAAPGMTLVEIMVAMALMSLVIMTLLGFVQNQAKTVASETTEIQLQSHMRRGMEDLAVEFTEARLRAIGSNALWIEYQLPLKGVSGFPVPKAGNAVAQFSCSMDFGARAYDGTYCSGGYYRLEFVDSTNPKDVINETDPNVHPQIDLNGDGDFGDTFVFGQLRQSVMDASGNPFRGASSSNDYQRDFSWRSARMSVNGGTANLATTGGIFYSRQLSAEYSASAPNEQRADTFTDANGNNVFDAPERTTDANGNLVIDLGELVTNDFNNNGRYDGPDCAISFVDKNHNNVYDPNIDLLQSINDHHNLDNSWTYFDACLTIRLMYIDRSSWPYTVRELQTKVQLRNHVLPTAP